jgi:hypothetical protein
MPAILAPIELPEFGLPTSQPSVPAATYEARIQAARARAGAAGYDALLVYGDREHSANVAYLTGYDPRFEETLLILLPEGKPRILVGVEGIGYIKSALAQVEPILYPSFSLLSMPRTAARPLETILREAGLREGMQIGLAGWKYYDQREADQPEVWLEAPAFIVDTLRRITGDPARVQNATALFMNPADGLRIINEVDQLAAFEFASSYSSQALRQVIFNLQPGRSEIDHARQISLPGIPHAAHQMLSAGERAYQGLPSPSGRIIGEGEPFTAAVSLWGALNARAGFVVRDAAGLPAGAGDYVEKLVKPYFEAAVAWYETIGLGVTGGELYEAVHARVGDPFFNVGLNPGHYIHLDEWVSSPVDRGSTIPLRSGMALQIDIIPATGTVYFTTNIEDGIALADAELRAALAAQYPEAWGRIQARRAFMTEVLGIRLRPEVLPFSNLAAYLPPYLLSPGLAMRMA